MEFRKSTSGQGRGYKVSRTDQDVQRRLRLEINATFKAIESAHDVRIYVVGPAAWAWSHGLIPDVWDLVALGDSPKQKDQLSDRRINLLPTQEQSAVGFPVRLNNTSWWVSAGKVKLDACRTAYSYQATLRESLHSRNFTCEQMAFRATGDPDSPLLFLNRQAAHDWYNRILRPAPDACFDWSTVLNASLLVSSFRGPTTIDSTSTLEKFQQAVAGFPSSSEIARTRPLAEFFLLLLSCTRPSRGLKFLTKIDWTKRYFPELQLAVGCNQNPKYHSYPVFEHLLTALDYACFITPRLDVRLAALCHDLGKPLTRKQQGNDPSSVTFHNHEQFSVDLTRQWMIRCKFPQELQQAVLSLVQNHQYNYSREWGDSAVRRFARRVGITVDNLPNLSEHPLFLLRQADRMGNKYKQDLPITPKQLDFENRIRKVLTEGRQCSE